MVFIYAQNVLHMTGLTTSLMVVGAGATGLVGLLVGRRLADHLGRRPTVALAMAGMVAAGSLAYQGGSGVLIAGYALGAFSGALFAPAGGALANELFPTAVRASVAGWNVAAGVLGAVAGLLVFGAVADASGGVDHAGTAALVTFLPVLPVAALLLLLPETAGHEPEELWGEPA
jgi:MFS family permease